MKRLSTPNTTWISFSILLLLGLLWPIASLKADHVVGSDLTYKCTATPGIFEVTLIVYRDCDGIEYCSATCGAACSRTIQIFGADPGCASTSFGTITLNLATVRDVNINPVCPDAKSICHNMSCIDPGFYTPGFERYEFKGIANIGPSSGIPASCCNVRFVWTECCRSAKINTGSTWDNFYMDAIINRCHSTTPCNNSPEFKNDPIAAMCGNDNFVFNNGATDPDFDSLTYAFAPALEAYGVPVTYIAPFSPEKPMPFTDPYGGAFPAGIRCDPETGDIMFTPGNASNDNFYGVMAIEIKQWKRINGVPTVIGITRRDVMLILLANCPPNNPPRLITNPPLGSNPNAPKTKWEICAGEQICFTVTAKDTDFVPITDTTYLEWNGALEGLGATFLPNYNPLDRHKPVPIGGPREDEYKFCWSPSDSLASTVPYYFTITGMDDRCPNPYKVTRSFSVKVHGRAELDIKLEDKKCGKFEISYDNLKASLPPTNVLWQISTVPGDYSMSQNPFTTNTKNPFTRTFTQGGKYLVILEARTPGPNGMQCTRVFYDTITVDTNVTAVVRDTFTCIGSSVQIAASAEHGNPFYTYRWYNSIKDTALPPLNNPYFSIPSYTVAPTSTRYYTIEVRDINGCKSFDSAQVSVKSLPVSVLIDSTRICYGDTFTLDAGNNSGNIRSYVWSTGDTTQTISRMDSGRYVIELTDTFNCKQVDSMMLYVNSRIIPNAGSDTSICYGDTMTLVGRGGQLYQWRDLSTGSVIVGKGYNNKVKVWPNNMVTPSKYELRVYTSYPDTTAKYKECSVTDTIQVTVRPLPNLIRPAITQACRSESTILLPGFANNQPGGTGVWTYPPAPGAIVSNGTSVLVDSLLNAPKKDTMGTFINWVQYKYTAPASFGGCSKRDSANVTIYGTPPTDAGSKLIHCENGGVYAITAAQQGYKPAAVGGTAEGEEWTGAGIYSTTVGSNKRWFFDPTRSGVNKLPAINIMTYKYTRTYNKGASNEISCFKADTVQFHVTDAPEIYAGRDLTICNNEPVFNISNRAGATITPTTGRTYWNSTTAGSVGTVIVNNQQDFNAPAVVIPSGSSSMLYTMYVSDTSTGCTVRDTMTIQVQRVPSVRIQYDNAAEYMNVCQNTKQVYIRVFATNSSGMEFEPASNLDLSESSASYGMNTLGTNTSRTVFNSTTAAPGMHLLKVKYTEYGPTGLGCSSTDTDNVKVLAPPSIAALTPQAICSYDPQVDVSLQGAPNAGYKFVWSTSGDGRYGDSSQVSTTYIPGAGDKTSGEVKLTATTLKKTVAELGTNGDQCPEASSIVTLYIDKAPQVAILSENTSGCVPLTSNFGAAPTGLSNAQFLWEWENEPTNTSTDSAISRTVEEYNTQVNGRYRPRLTVSSFVHTTCSATSGWSSMQARAVPKADFSPDPRETTIAKPFFNFTNNSIVIDGSNMTYLWNLGPGPDLSDRSDRFTTEMNPMNIEYAADTACQKVTLRTTTQYGCVDSTDEKICIKPDITVFIPNAFMPDDENGNPNSLSDCYGQEDHCNRKFRVVANGYMTIEIFVYNRWGQLVYKGTTAEEGWNGRVMNTGELCPQEVYVYQVNASSFSGKKFRYSGSVTLLR